MLSLWRSTFGDFLPQQASILERFRVAAQAGCDGLELECVDSDRDAALVREAIDATGVAVHSVKTKKQRLHPFTSSDHVDVEISVRTTRRALENARLWNARTVLVLPGIVTPDVSYSEAHDRALRVLRDRVLPLAAENGIVLAIENSWNDFFLGPSDFVRFIDDLDSPYAKAYLDVGNLMFGLPEHWVRALGPRLFQLHAKDFAVDLRRQRFAFRDLGDGQIDWRALRDALEEIGFSGWVVNTVPVLPGGESIVRRVHRRAMRSLGLPEAPWTVLRRRAVRDIRHRMTRIDEVLRHSSTPS